MKHFCLLSVLLITVFQGLSQAGSGQESYLEKKLPAFIPPSPNASSIVKLANIQADNYTGLLNLSIPVYTISLKQIKIPVSLGYNSSGVKVEEYSSSCGMSWSLNAGGVIIRTVKGMPDDCAVGYMREMSFPGVGIMKTGAYVNLYVQNLLSDADKKEFEKSAAKGSFDTEPDIYSYSFPGKSGKFFISPAGNIIPIPYEPIKISGNFGASNNVLDFIIVDELGNKYEFKTPEGTFSYTSVYDTETNTFTSPINPEMNTNAWYLSKVITPLNEEVSFEYLTSSIEPKYNSYQTRYFLAEDTYPNYGCAATPPHVSQFSVKTSSEQQIAQKKIHKINFNEGYIEFDYGLARQDLQGDAALTAIKLNNHNGLLKSYNLSYLYYSNRLFLKEVSESNGTTAIPPYKLEYYNAGELPDRLSYSQDHWGFYNGAANTSLIPMSFKEEGTYPLMPAILGDANREPDEIKMKYGTLSKIIYPTGGYSIFEFEVNRYSKIGEANISDVTYTIVNNTESIIALANGTGNSGNTFTIGHTQSIVADYNLYGNETFVKIVKIVNGQEVQVYNKSGNSYAAISGTDYPLLYPGTYKLKAFNYEEQFHATLYIQYKSRTNPQTVTEKIGGGIRIYKISDYDPLTNNSRTQKFVYKTNLTDTYSSGVLLNNAFYDYFQPLWRAQGCPSYNGPPGTVTSVYLRGNYYIKLSVPAISLATTHGSFVGYKSVYIYNNEGTTNGYIKRQYRTPDNFPDQNFVGFPFTPNISKDVDRGQVTIEEVAKNTSTKISETINGYNNENYVPNMDWLAGGANVGLIENFPLNDLSNIYSSHTYNIFSRYIKSSSIKTIIIDENSNQLIDQKDISYDNPLHLLPTSEKITNSKGETKATYILYPQDYESDNSFIGKMIEKNIIAFPVEKISTNEAGGTIKILSATTIEYKETIPVIPNKVFAIETISPIPLNHFKFSNKPIGVMPFPVTSKTTFQKNSNYKEAISILSIDAAGNVLSQQRKNDVLHTFIWGYNKTYPVAQVTGVNYAIASSFINQTLLDDPNSSEAQVKSQLDNLRLGLASTKALVTTFTYKPLVGMTSETDPSGRTIYYEYDSFNRLKLIRDQNNNIIKKFCYNYTGQHENCQ